ncbi:MAG: DUF2911 domain-containing protein [Flavobacteriales bacterium]|nr:DUF2911 domain-containing protein [Flavobacteriales bacterium]
MKKIATSFLALFLMVWTLQAQELPQPSPYAEVMQRVGLTDISMEYSRPGVKDRVIFGDLEPFDQVWRTGANSSTKIEFSSDVKIGGVEVKAGKYSIMSMPGKEMWKVYINTDLGVQEGSYKAENNVAEVSVKPIKTDKTVETLSFWFSNVKGESVDLMFAWENTSLVIPIEVAAKEAAMENIDSKIKEIENAYGVYNNSAKYYLTNDLDLEKALAWSEKSVEIAQKFWNVQTLSKIQYAMGNKKEAIKTAELSLKLSEEADYQPYIKMNKENIAKWSK